VWICFYRASSQRPRSLTLSVSQSSSSSTALRFSATILGIFGWQPMTIAFILAGNAADESTGREARSKSRASARQEAESRPPISLEPIDVDKVRIKFSARHEPDT